MKKVLIGAMVFVLLISAQAFAVELVNNALCPVMGGKVDGTHYAIYDGKAYGVCCPDCVAAFEAEPEKYIAVLTDEKAAECAGKSSCSK